MKYCELRAAAAWIGNRFGGVSDPALLRGGGVNSAARKRP
jgi:hypothetical protein